MLYFASFDFANDDLLGCLVVRSANLFLIVSVR